MFSSDYYRIRRHHSNCYGSVNGVVHNLDNHQIWQAMQVLFRDTSVTNRIHGDSVIYSVSTRLVCLAAICYNPTRSLATKFSMCDKLIDID